MPKHKTPRQIAGFIASFNATLAELGNPWRIEPVLGIKHGFALSKSGTVQFEKLADLADELGTNDLSDLEDYLSPREPWCGIAGFVLVGADTKSEIEACVAWWAAGKLGLLGMLPTSVRDAHPDIVLLASDR